MTSIREVVSDTFLSIAPPPLTDEKLEGMSTIKQIKLSKEPQPDTLPNEDNDIQPAAW